MAAVGPPPLATGGPPPVPPSMPGPRPPAAPARSRPEKPAPELDLGGSDPFDFLSEWPRDPAPPKGTPEEKLEYFRERLKARDTFLGKVREAVAGVKAHVAQLGDERDLVQQDLERERARAEELEGKLAEGSQEAAAQAARLEEVQRQLADSETTRQSLSDVLSETMQEREASEQEFSERLGKVESDRSRLEAQLSEQADAHAKALAALEGERAEDRARAESARTDSEASFARSMQEAQAEREKERADAAAKQTLADEQMASLGAERDGLAADVKRLEGEIAARAEELQAARRDGEEVADALRLKLEEANARGESLSAQIDEGVVKIGALEEQLHASRGEVQAYEEKLAAVEHELEGREAELAAAGQRVADVSSALDEGRAAMEGMRGELSRIDAARADAEKRLAQTTEERDRFAGEVVAMEREVEAARADTDAERGRVQELETEVARLAKLEPIAEEALRLRKEVAALREMVQQRTSAAESSSRAAQAAAAERARAEERLAVEGGKLQSLLSRSESELAAARHRLEEIEREGSSRDASLRKAAHDAEERRKAIASEAADSGRRHDAEIGRLKAAMVEMERHLEVRARAELQFKKKIQELERAAQGRPAGGADAAEVQKLRAQVAKLTEEVEEMKGENDFLNGEVARYVQKNKDLSSRPGRPADVTKPSRKPSGR